MKTNLFNLLTWGYLLVIFNVSGQNTDSGFELIRNIGGKDISYSKSSGIKILNINGLFFKDLNRSGKLDPYEDWRLSYDQRAKDLASRLSIEQIAGLMLYSSHQSIPARTGGYFAGTYGGNPFKEGETHPAELTDQQEKFLKEDNLRHILITTVKSPEIAAEWNNNIQAYCESLGLGIPANNSSDPRHGIIASAEYNAGAGGAISMWPGSLGMAATFDPELVRKFGTIAAAEYRALGITTALSPQVDIATEPRWSRFSGTFGESPRLSAAMAEAYCDGFQSESWSSSSVNAMVKHWPGGGSGEAGRDAHYGNGKFAVYPGNNFDVHLIPFINGAFQLRGSTKAASAVMPYYTISWNQTPENVANNFDRYIIDDLLRKKYGYTGVICTDWNVTGDRKVLDSFLDGKSFGVEHLSLAERHYKVLKAGVDQFGGNNDVQPILEAYQIGVREHGEKRMRSRMEESAIRLLLNIFRVGLFENPYLDSKKTQKLVGNHEFMKSGYEAQLKSIVLLKNQQNVLPLAIRKTVYIPKRFIPASRNFLGIETPASLEYPINIDVVKKHFDVTDDPDKADFAILYIENPKASIGYDKADIKNGGNGYVPISLQYGDYLATDAREVSIAGGDPLENFTNRSYKGKTAKTPNITDAQLVKSTKEAMKDKPLILIVSTTNPLIFSEIEPYASSVLLSFGVQDQALIEIIAGRSEPQALLPMQMPANMQTVEKQAEDVPYDMECYNDAVGNVYDFGFGLNWKGIIQDERKTVHR